MGPTALRTTLRCGTGGLASWAFPAAATEAAGRGAAAGARAATGHLPHHSLPAAAVRAASTAAQGGLGSGSRTGASDGGGSGSRAATAYDPGKSYDAVVVGLGAYGSAALYHLARRGLKVLGIERHASIGHTYGSSHGATRITRLAYFEGPQYYGLIKRSLALFMDLEAELGARAAAGGQPAPPPLFQRTGMLDIGSVFERSLESARAHGLQHEVLTGAELNRRFPAYRVPGEWRALLQPDGGVLAPERIMQAQVAFAQEAGAEVALGEGVASWRAGGGGGGGVEVTTTSGRRVVAGAAVLAAGPWMGCLVPELQELCVPERQVVGWFDIEVPSRPLFAPDRFPVFLIEETPGGDAYYGFPEQADRPGFKIGKYHHLHEQLRGGQEQLDAMRRTPDAADEAALRRGAAAFFPAAGSGRLLSASACLFTNTPDGHFLVDRHPRHPQVVLCSACSGHGFKMSSGIGELLAHMVAAGPSAADQDPGSRSASGTGLESDSAADAKSLEAGDMGAGMRLMRPFRLDPGRRGGAAALARFGASG